MEEIKIEEINLETGQPIVSEDRENLDKKFTSETFTSFMNSLSDLLLNHDDFEYNIVRCASERMSDAFDISEHLDTDFISKQVIENIDLSDLASELEEHIDYDNLASKTVYEIDYGDLAAEVDSYIDYRSVAERIEESINFFSVAEGLLSDYDPDNSCTTGNAFTRAIARALEYMMENSEEEEFEVMQSLMNRNAIVVERTVDSDRNVVTETVLENNQQESSYEAALVQTGTDENGVAVMSEMKVPNDDFIYTLMKRIVNDLLSEYVSSFDTDPFMRIRMEAKAFDIYHEMKG